MNENVRKNRIKNWIIWIIIALLCVGVEKLWTNVIFKEKETFTVCAPDDMDDAFKLAFKLTDLDKDYKFIMTDDPTNANVVVDYGKADDSSYTKFAFSPFVVAYNYSYYENLSGSDLLVENATQDGFCEFELSNLIDAILEEKEWKDYGMEDLGKIRVVYPHPSTIYWEDFYDLMLIAANNGKYPVDSNEYTQAVNKLDSFFASDNTEAIINYEEKITLSYGFTKDIFYIGPEKVFFNLNGESGALMPPTETVNFNFYMKTDELGSAILSKLDEGTVWDSTTFYDKLSDSYYRNSKRLTISNRKNLYNVILIPKDVEWKVEKEG